MALPGYIVTSSSPVSDVADATLLAATTAGNGAALIGIEDSGLKYTGTTVEAALAEIGAGTTLDSRYLKLDQTSGQTTTGTFTFPAVSTYSLNTVSFNDEAVFLNDDMIFL